MQALLDQIERHYDKNRMTIIGVDGLGGAGKSTISALLCERLRERHPVTVLHIDDFIQPKSVRYNSHFAEWECYYLLQWRYTYFLEGIIRPLRCEGHFCRDVELYDKDQDSYYLKHMDIPVGSIVIVEGIFLQRMELGGVFDYMIYLDIPEATRLDRVLQRDSYIGTPQQIREKYENRYFPAERVYVKRHNPAARANFIICAGPAPAAQTY